MAASLELFVAFALIHDDIMDDSASRRGRPAVHRTKRARLGQDERAERLGAGGALLVGNLASMWAQELLHTVTMNVFTRLGLPLGEAFQLRDDLLDVFGSPDGTSAAGLGDLREGKRTVLPALGLRHADQVQRELLHRPVGRAGLGMREAAEVRAVLEATGAREQTERMIAPRYEQVLRVLDAAGFPRAADRALRGLAVTATRYSS